MTANDRYRADVVLTLVGGFNPLIVQPDWLFANDLVDLGDRDSALESENILVSPEYTAARYPWAALEVTRGSVLIGSTDATEAPDRIRELAIGIFSLLPHTPISSVRISYTW